jgi:hypothetical protein
MNYASNNARVIADHLGCKIQAVHALAYRLGLTNKEQQYKSMRKVNIAFDQLKKLYIDEELNPREIGERLNVDSSTIADWILALGIPSRSLSEARKLSEKKKRLRYEAEGKRYESWKGGRYTHSDGYVYVTPKIGMRPTLEHRWLWEQANGPIPKDHHIHHLNGIRNDNRLENLICVPKREHNKFGSPTKKLLELRIRELEEKLNDTG